MAVETAGMEIIQEEQCLSLLGGRSLGRIAVTVGAVPAIFPVNYRMLDGQIVFRAVGDTKLHQAADHAVVAFEVDELDPTTHAGWSVLVVGMAHEVRGERDGAAASDHVIAITPEFVSGHRIAAA